MLVAGSASVAASRQRSWRCGRSCGARRIGGAVCSCEPTFQREPGIDHVRLLLASHDDEEDREHQAEETPRPRVELHAQPSLVILHWLNASGERDGHGTTVDVNPPHRTVVLDALDLDVLARFPLGPEQRALADRSVGELLHRHRVGVPLELVPDVDEVVERLLG